MQALWACVRSLLAAHDTLQARVRQSAFSFAPHPGLAQQRQQLAQAVMRSVASAQPSAALPHLHRLGVLAEDSLQYLQRYHWKALYGSVLACYVLWALALLLRLLRHQGAQAGSEGARAGRRPLLAAIVVLSGGSAGALLTLRLPVRRCSCSCLWSALACARPSAGLPVQSMGPSLLTLCGTGSGANALLHDWRIGGACC